ncbi:hypothetical protein BDZ45DRAFT_283266 [Acephala macrosclerotiorum]|nr:hypothetical protein BDZ45DRAFT_283266 [Acephala macrosclerotiorum]
MIVKVGGIEIDPAKTPFNKKAAKWEKDHTCQQYALFFHDISSAWVFLALVFFAVLSIIFTVCILYPRYHATHREAGPPPPPQATSTDVEATAILGDSGTSMAAESDNPEESDEPPPYQPPATETTPQTTLKPPVKRSSAQRFVIGVCLLVCDIAALFLLALPIQSVVFCQDW